MGRRHRRHVQKLQQSRVRILSDGVLRAIGVKASGHVDRDSQLPGYPVE